MELKTLIAAEADKIDQVMREDLADLGSDLDSYLIEILQYGLFSGGKRVRPLLTILCSRLGGESDRDAYRLATAFEYLHAATLFHDDVIDRADSRRGRLSVNKRYGMVGAILAGDFLHAHAMALVGELGGIEALDVFTRATRGMVDGEFIQLRNAARFNQSEEDYFSVIMGKTALLIGAACEIGGMYGGANGVMRQALRTYGINLGCAFQIIDDLLDYCGDKTKTGKAVGNDLAEGKMTLPLILAMQNADEADRRELLGIMNNEGERGEKLLEVKALISKYGGFEKARAKAEAIIAEADEALAVFAGGEQEKSLTILRGLSQYVLRRDA